MKIMYFTIGIDNLRGGARNSTYKLYKNLKLISNNILLVNFPSCLIDKFPSPLNAIIYNKRIEEFFRKQVKIHNPDIIHLTGYSGFYINPKEIKIPIIYTIRDDPSVGNDATEGYSFNLIKNYWTFYYKFISKKILRIISEKSNQVYFHCLSTNMIKSLKKLGVESRNIIRVPNGSDRKYEVVKPTNSYPKRRTVIIGYVGAIEYRKGFDRIVKLARKSPENFRYFIAGDLNFIISKLYLSRLKIPENLIFLGHLSRQDIHKFYLKCDIIIVPSRSESFGNVAIEALIHKNILFMTNTGIANEIRSYENVKFLSEFENQFILDFIYSFSNKKENLEFSQFHWFGWEEIASRFLSIYSDIVYKQFS